MKKYIKRVFPERFDKYWNSIKDKENLDKTLKEITENFIESDSYDLVSNYWHVLNIQNYKSLIKSGLSKYGSTIARNYYTFSEIFHDEWFDQAIKNLEDKPFNIQSNEIFKKQDGFSLKESIGYNYICYILFYNLKKLASFQNINKIKDDAFLGFNDPYINIENFKVTTDKIASLLDYEKISKAFEINSFKKILEIGAGSGRTCETVLSIKKNLKYIICDISPAIYISFKRLKLSFPEKKINLLININDGKKLTKEIEENDISFIFPHQLRIIKDKFFDLALGIDCFHEMDKKVIDYYFDNLNKIVNYVYFSIWEKTTVPYSKNIFKKENRLDYSLNDYKIPKNWEQIFKEKLVFPSNQLSLGFKVLG